MNSHKVPGRKSAALPLSGGLLWENDVYGAIKKGAQALDLAPTDFSYFLDEENTLNLMLEVPGKKASPPSAGIPLHPRCSHKG